MACVYIRRPFISAVHVETHSAKEDVFVDVRIQHVQLEAHRCRVAIVIDTHSHWLVIRIRLAVGVLLVPIRNRRNRAKPNVFPRLDYFTLARHWFPLAFSGKPRAILTSSNQQPAVTLSQFIPLLKYIMLISSRYIFFMKRNDQ